MNYNIFPLSDEKRGKAASKARPYPLNLFLYYHYIIYIMSIYQLSYKNSSPSLI